MVQNHLKGPFDPKYIGNYRVVSLKGNQVETQPAVGGPTEVKHIKHVKYSLPADQFVKQIPDYSAFRRKATLRLDPDKIPDLHWQLLNTYHTTNVGQLILQTSNITTLGVDVDTTRYAGRNKYEGWSGMTLNTDTIPYKVIPTLWSALSHLLVTKCDIMLAM